MRNPTETDLLRACKQLLELRGWLVLRINSGAIITRSGRPVRCNSEPGCSDLLVCGPSWVGGGGKFLAVEVKLPGRRLTPGQRSFLERVNRQGGVGLCVRSLRELEVALENLERNIG